MKTSINFKVVKSDSETHNFRKKTFDYIRKDLTPKNEYWMEQKIADRIQRRSKRIAKRSPEENYRRTQCLLGKRL